VKFGTETDQLHAYTLFMKYCL